MSESLLAPDPPAAPPPDPVAPAPGDPPVGIPEGAAPAAPPAAPAPPPAAAPYSPFAIFADGKVNPQFADWAKDEPHLIKLAEKYAGAADPAKAFAQGIRNLQFLAGQKALEPLPADAPDTVKQERRALLNKLHGVPESPDGYGLAKPENIPPGVLWPEGSEKKYAEAFHKHGAPPEMVKELMDLHMQTLVAGEQEVERQVVARREAQLAELRKEHGADLPKVLEQARMGARTLGLSDEDAIAISTSAAVVRALARVTALVAEDKLVAADGQPAAGKGYREQALDIMYNPNNPLNAAYRDLGHPQHEAAWKEKSRLNEMHHKTLKR